MSRIGKVGVSFTSLLTVGVVWLIHSQPPPPGPWVAPYVAYPIAWLCLGLISVSLVTLAWRRDLHDTIVVISGVIFVNCVLLFSHLWGVPLGGHDVWVHLNYIKTGIFVTRNPYPAMHMLAVVLSLIFDTPPTIIISYLTHISATLAILFLWPVLQRTSTSPRTQQVAFFVGIPSALLIGLSPGPFTIAWPFVLAIFWILISTWSTRSSYILILIVVSGVFYHPQLPVFSLPILAVVWVVKHTLPAILRWFERKEMTVLLESRPQGSITATVLVLSGIIVVAQLFYYSSLGTSILGSVVTLLTASVDASQTATGTKQPLLVRIISNPDVLSEAIRRVSYHIGVGVVVLLGTIQLLRQRRIHYPTLLIIGSLGVLAGLFVVVDVGMGSSVVNTRRFLKLSPVLLIIPVARLIQLRDQSLMTLGYCIFIFLIGLAMVYPGPYIGAIGQSNTEEQVSTVEWIGDYGGEAGVVGSGNTFWIAEGVLGKQAMYEMGRPGIGTSPEVHLRTRSERFAWEVRSDNRPLYHLSGVDRQLAAHQASETGDRTPLDNYWRFQRVTDKIYSNGEDTVNID